MWHLMNKSTDKQNNDRLMGGEQMTAVGLVELCGGGGGIKQKQNEREKTHRYEQQCGDFWDEGNGGK